MKTKDLMDDALDWAVAKCEGRTLMRRQDYFRHKGKNETFIASLPNDLIEVTPDRETFLAVSTGYSRDRSLAEAIIEREGIAIFPARQNSGVVWCADLCKAGFPSYPLHDLDNRMAWWFEESEVITGPTPLVAAMRCYVASRLGEEIELPAGLEAA